MGSDQEQRMTGNDSRNESARETTSAAETGAETQLEFSSDESWKNRVKAEDAAFDEKFGPKDAASMQTAPVGNRAATDDRSAERGTEPLFPEPSFAGLLGM